MIMKFTSIVAISILGAEVALAVPTALEDGHAYGSALDNRKALCIAKNDCGSYHPPSPGPSDQHATGPELSSSCFDCIGSKAKRTLITVTTPDTTELVEPDPTPGEIDFFGPKPAARALAVKPDTEPPTNADGFSAPKDAGPYTETEPQVTKGSVGFTGPKIKDRVTDETPCVVENDCPEKSSATPSTTEMAPASTITLGNAHTSVSAVGSPATTAPNPTETCSQGTGSQTKCVPVSATKKFPLNWPRETDTPGAKLLDDRQNVPCNAEEDSNCVSEDSPASTPSTSTPPPAPPTTTLTTNSYSGLTPATVDITNSDLPPAETCSEANDGQVQCVKVTRKRTPGPEQTGSA